MDKWINKNITPPPIDQPIEVKDLISKKIKIACFFPYMGDGEWHEINSDDTIGERVEFTFYR